MVSVLMVLVMLPSSYSLPPNRYVSIHITDLYGVNILSVLFRHSHFRQKRSSSDASAVGTFETRSSSVWGDSLANNGEDLWHVKPGRRWATRTKRGGGGPIFRSQ